MSKRKSAPIEKHEAGQSLGMSRRTFVKSAALVAGGAVLVGTNIRPAAAQQKLAQAAVKYQNTPNGSMECSNCMQFIPGKTADATGSCKVVEGSINPHGYCIAWVAKPK
jgi:hypothetical protein